jgi:hypothetical protein
MQRRTLLGLGVVGSLGVAVLAGGSAWVLRSPAWHQGALSPAGREILLAVGQAVLEGSLPDDPTRRDQALDAFLTRLATAIASLPPATQLQIDELLSLLATAPGRHLIAALPQAWSTAPAEDVQVALQSMRTSSLALRRQAYHALRDLTQGAFFADPGTWAALGYPGPNPITAASA